jgi:prephenate dehydrogenase
MDRKIAVIGAGGKMGSWFVGYFARRDALISAYDANRESLRSIQGNAFISETLADSVKDADMVIICVPVHLTPKVISECGRHMKPGAAICEISSVKHQTFRTLAKISRSLTPLCIHPMFGPGASDKKQFKILMIPVRREESELRLLRETFEEASIKVLPNAKAHDNAIAVILGLTYFINIVFAKVVARKRMEVLKEISGTTFGIQSMLAESILTDEPSLISALITGNPSAASQIRHYVREATRIAKAASTKNSRQLEKEVRQLKRLRKDQDLQNSYRRLYEIVETLKS